MTNTVAVGAVAPGENAEPESTDHFTACDMATAAAQGFRDGQSAMVVPEGWLKALDEAVTAIYFDDGSDFRSALLAVVRNLFPRIADELDRNETAAWHMVRDMLAAAPTPEPASRDWPDGDYYGTCSVCRQQFAGHKRQLVCLLCSEQPAKEQDHE